MPAQQCRAELASRGCQKHRASFLIFFLLEATGSKDSLKNFIITKINDKEIETADEAVKILENVAQSRYSIVIEMINTEGEKERLRFR